jgi:glucan 1,3-beta-glucosidase
VANVHCTVSAKKGSLALSNWNQIRQSTVRLGVTGAVAVAVLLSLVTGGRSAGASEAGVTPDSTANTRSIAYHGPGVTYNGLHATENPMAQEVADDLKRIKHHFGVIRTYYAQFGGGAVDVGKVAADVGIKMLVGLYLYPGHPDWIAKDYNQFVKPAVSRGNVIGVIIGNEDSDQLATVKDYLSKARSDFPQTPVSSSQTAGFWLTDPRADEILPLVDFIAVNIYPAWDWEKADADLQPIGVTPQSGFQSFRATFERVATKYPGKQVVVTETGWPTSYGTLLSKQFPIGISNARDYLKLVMTWAETSDPQINLYVYGMFDPRYGVGLGSLFNYHFGLVDSDGKAKGVLF